eukprot:Opistho-1_new@5402
MTAGGGAGSRRPVGRSRGSAVVVAAIFACVHLSLAWTAAAAVCGNSQHYCETACPFANATACSQASTQCAGIVDGQPLTPLCEAFIAAYCAQSPTDPGCCGGSKPVRCLVGRHCVASSSECPASNCQSVNVPCSFGRCVGGYSCGGGCVSNRTQTCPVNTRCVGGYTCGDNVCTSVLGQCDPPVGNFNNDQPQCPSNMRYCGKECPFGDKNFCSQLDSACSAGIYSAACNATIATYCASNFTDPGCCGGATPFRCASGFCAASPSACNPNPYCARFNETCPAESKCPGGNYCGDTSGRCVSPDGAAQCPEHGGIYDRVFLLDAPRNIAYLCLKPRCYVTRDYGLSFMPLPATVVDLVGVDAEGTVYAKGDPFPRVVSHDHGSTFQSTMNKFPSVTYATIPPVEGEMMLEATSPHPWVLSPDGVFAKLDSQWSRRASWGCNNMCRRASNPYR